MFTESGWLKCTVREDPPPMWVVGLDVVARVQVEYSGDRNQAVWELTGSIDGVNFFPFSPAVELTANGMTPKVDIAGVRVLRVSLSTLETTTADLKARFFIHTQTTDAS